MNSVSATVMYYKLYMLSVVDRSTTDGSGKKDKKELSTVTPFERQVKFPTARLRYIIIHSYSFICVQKQNGVVTGRNSAHKAIHT